MQRCHKSVKSSVRAVAEVAVSHTLLLLQKLADNGAVLLRFFDEREVPGFLEHHEGRPRHEVFVLNGESRYRDSIPSACKNQSGRLDFPQPGAKIQRSQFTTQKNIGVRSG